MNRNFLDQLVLINAEDLDYVETDLSFPEKVSISLLLFGEENAQFILQKILVMLNSRDVHTDVLRCFSKIDPDWKIKLIEALAVIKSKRVLRKLGFKWSDIKQHFLPHISAISLRINPILKALYVMCEQLTPKQVQRFVLEIQEQHQNPVDHLRFYDYSYLEVFLLDWMTRKIISIKPNCMPNIQILIEYFKMNEMDDIQSLLKSSLKALPSIQLPTEQALDDSGEIEESNDENYLGAMKNLNMDETYSIERDSAGFILIINQQQFYRENDPHLKAILPSKPLLQRNGTNQDKHRLKSVFSSFGYIPVEYDNLSHIQMLGKIRDIVKRSVLYDSLIVCILTHGIEGFVYGSNSIPVNISDIEKIMTGEALHQKPKVLIIQSCQKDESKEIKISNSSSGHTCPIYYSDMVKAMSTVPGHSSIRDTKEGTWFIQSLCNAVEQHGDKKHILDILTTVTRDVANKRGDNNEVMVPLTSQTLTKNLFLPKRQN